MILNNMSNIMSINPYHVNFSTSSISNHFTSGMFLDEIFSKIINGQMPMYGEQGMPLIEVVFYNREYWVARGNRRLYVMRKLYIAGFLDSIHVILLDWTNSEAYERFFNCFTTTCDGRYIRVRDTALIDNMDDLIRDVTIEWWKNRGDMSQDYDQSHESSFNNDKISYDNVSNSSKTDGATYKDVFKSFREFVHTSIQSIPKSDDSNFCHKTEPQVTNSTLKDVKSDAELTPRVESFSDLRAGQLVDYLTSDVYREKITSEMFESAFRIDQLSANDLHKLLTSSFRSYWCTVDESRNSMEKPRCSTRRRLFPDDSSDIGDVIRSDPAKRGCIYDEFYQLMYPADAADNSGADNSDGAFMTPTATIAPTAISIHLVENQNIFSMNDANSRKKSSCRTCTLVKKKKTHKDNPQKEKKMTKEEGKEFNRLLHQLSDQAKSFQKGICEKLLTLHSLGTTSPEKKGADMKQFMTGTTQQSDDCSLRNLASRKSRHWKVLDH